MIPHVDVDIAALCLGRHTPPIPTFAARIPLRPLAAWINFGSIAYIQPLRVKTALKYVCSGMG